MKKNIIVIIVFSIALLLVALVIYRRSSYQSNLNLPPSVSTPLEKQYPKLESTLVQLINSRDHKTFAQSHGIDLEGERARVIIETTTKQYILPKEFGTEETRYKNQLQALIKIDKLLVLADDPSVKRIYVPISTIPLK